MNPERVPDDSDLLGFPEGVGPFVAGRLQSGLGSGVLGSELSIFPRHLGAVRPSGAVERIPIRSSHAGAGGGFGRSSAPSRKISWNVCRAMATSAIWKIT